jgi:hypothetical protein
MKEDEDTKKVLPLTYLKDELETLDEWCHQEKVTTGVTPEPPLTLDEEYAAAPWFRRFAVWLMQGKKKG